MKCTWSLLRIGVRGVVACCGIAGAVLVAGVEVRAEGVGASVAPDFGVPSLGLAPGAAWGGQGSARLPALAVTALGEEGDDRGDIDELRNFGFKLGIGFSVDPGTFLVGLQGDFYPARNISLGPLLQIGGSNDTFLFAPTLDLGYIIDIPGEGMENLKPSIHLGLGLMYLDEERKGDDEDVGFLINPGLAIDYFVTPYFALGSTMYFNFIPTSVNDEYFIWSWQVLTFRIQF